MRILFITSHKFDSPNVGGIIGSLRNYEVLCQLAEVEKITVDVAFTRGNRIRQSLFYFPFFQDSGTRRIIEYAVKERFDLIFLDSSLFGKIAEYLKKRGAGMLVAFFHNCEQDYYRVLMNSSRVNFIKSRYAKISEKLTIRYSDQIITLNGRDQKRIEELYGRKSDAIIPVTVRDKMKTERFTNKKGKFLLFVGNNFPPNYEGIRWFIVHVLPKLNTGLVIVGRNFERDKTALEGLSPSGQVSVIGTVRDVSPYYLDAQCIVAPIFAGAGMKIKTAEALMYGKYIFGTKEAFEGFSLDYSRTGGLCNTAGQFIDGISRFLEETEENTFNPYARSVYNKSYSDEAALLLFQKIIKIQENE